MEWRKDPDFVLESDARWYERNDWRDPFIFRGCDGTWQMLLCARIPDGPSDRRGTFGLATSADMSDWTIQPPFLTPGTTRAPECPDLFREGSNTYLVYAGFSDRFATRYLMATSADGPWQSPVHDALEAPDVYAMKTATDGEHRYLMGWLSTRSGDRDSGHRQWGGDLLVHRLSARPDGTLGVAPVPTLLERFAMSPAIPRQGLGAWTSTGEDHLFTGDGVGWLPLDRMAGTCMLEATVDLALQADEIAIVLRADDDLEHGYHIRLEPRRGRFVFDRRPHHISIPFEPESDRAYVDAPDRRDRATPRPLSGRGASPGHRRWVGPRRLRERRGLVDPGV